MQETDCDNKQTNKQTNTQTNTNKHTNKQTHKQTNKHTNKQKQKAASSIARSEVRKHRCSPTLLLGAFANLRKASISFDMSVRPSARNNSGPTGRIFMKFEI